MLETSSLLSTSCEHTSWLEAPEIYLYFYQECLIFSLPCTIFHRCLWSAQVDSYAMWMIMFCKQHAMPLFLLCSLAQLFLKIVNISVQSIFHRCVWSDQVEAMLMFWIQHAMTIYLLCSLAQLFLQLVNASFQSIFHRCLWWDQVDLYAMWMIMSCIQHAMPLFL